MSARCAPAFPTHRGAARRAALAVAGTAVPARVTFGVEQGTFGPDRSLAPRRPMGLPTEEVAVMWPFDRSTATARPPVFRQCAVCEFDFVTGEGERSCHWSACPYLPAALDPTCPVCNYNFATDEGRPHCDDLATCEEAAAGYDRAVAVLVRFGG